LVSFTSTVVGARGGFFLAFDVVPDFFHFFERGVGRGCALSGEALFDGAKAPFEFAVGAAQSGFGIDIQFTREIGHRKKNVAEFVFEEINKLLGVLFVG